MNRAWSVTSTDWVCQLRWANQKRTRREARLRVIKMEFWTYMNSVMLIPAQVIRTARQRVFRL
ncbi:MAG: hypothetical protein WBB27_03575, partial [Maribacter sp.]